MKHVNNIVSILQPIIMIGVLINMIRISRLHKKLKKELNNQ